jgi:hypothetical protein
LSPLSQVSLKRMALRTNFFFGGVTYLFVFLLLNSGFELSVQAEAFFHFHLRLQSSNEEKMVIL